MEIQLLAGDELLLIIPAGVAAAGIGIVAYVVKKKDRERQRMHDAHQRPQERSPKSSDRR